MAFSYFSCWKGVSTEPFPNKLPVLQKTHKTPGPIFFTVWLSFSLCALQPQLNTWGALCPLSTWLQLGCANELVTQMSRASLASRQQLWSLASTSAKQMASLHLFPNIHLDLFFRVNTAIIYFSGAAEKGPRWETALVVVLCSVVLIETISLVSP